MSIACLIKMGYLRRRERMSWGRGSKGEIEVGKFEEKLSGLST